MGSGIHKSVLPKWMRGFTEQKCEEEKEEDVEGPVGIIGLDYTHSISPSERTC